MSLTACEQRWGFLHARDAASAFRLTLTRRDAGGLYNLGSFDAPPLEQTVSAIRDLVNPSAELGFGEIPYRPDQVMVLQADMHRLQSLGWKQEVDIHEGLSQTVAWFNARKRH
jgi:nucleoside-diphosphate-sugar epimerase